MDYVRCDGTTHYVSWSDDSYSQGSYTASCPGWPKCRSEAAALKHAEEEGTMEAHGRAEPRIPTTAKPAVTIKVSIPVKIGGYTGQRDQWEEHTYDMVVTGDQQEVELQAQGSFHTKITLSPDAISAALKALNVHKPVTR